MKRKSSVPQYVEKMYRRACELLRIKRMTRRELALEIPCGYTTLYYDIIARLINEEPELSERIATDADMAEMIELANGDMQRQGWYDVDKIARETYYAPEFVRMKLDQVDGLKGHKGRRSYQRIKQCEPHESTPLESKLQEMEELDYQIHCGGTPERDDAWIEFIRKRNGLGFEFTGVYWERYKVMYNLRRRGFQWAGNPRGELEDGRARRIGTTTDCMPISDALALEIL